MAPARHAPIEPFRQALLVGVWEYEGRDLASLQSDLDDLQTLFRDFGFDAIDVLANPTQAEFMAALAVAVQRAEAEVKRRSALSVVAFAGHGAMVGHTSWMLASDYRTPAHSSDLGLCGGLACDYVAGRLAASGAPALLLVEACRTPLVVDAHSGAPTPSRHPAVPVSNSGYACFFAQAPGAAVEVVPRIDGRSGPLVAAMQASREMGGSARNFFTAVARHLRTATAQLRHSWQPQYLDQGAGEIHLFFTAAERAADLACWQRVRDTRSATLVGQFLAVYRGSRHRGEALRLLATLQANLGNEQPRGLAGIANGSAATRTPRFWRSPSVQPVLCSASRILDGDCPLIEAQARRLLAKRSAPLPRLDVAMVLRPAEPAGGTFERSLAICERLVRLGVPPPVLVFQTLRPSDSPHADATILLR